MLGNTCCVGANLNEETEVIVIKADKTSKKRKFFRSKSKKEKEQKMSEQKQNIEPPSKLKKAVYWLCGIESHVKQDNLPEVEEVIDTSITTDPFWSMVCDVNAIIAIGLSVFCFAFFNLYE